MTANQLLELAKAELGIKESPPNSNQVKYNADYYGRNVSGSSYPWCCAFVWWLFRKGGASALFYGGEKTAYCPTLMAYHKKQGQFISDNYQPGDIIFFNFAGKQTAAHVGVCESYNGSTITTIDGNTGTSNEADGGAVMRRTRKKKYIVGAYRPAYEAETKPALVMYETELPLLKQGADGDCVKGMQLLLSGRDCPTGGCDGKFGPNTDTALRKFQKERKLTVDGKCGPETWKALIGV